MAKKKAPTKPALDPATGKGMLEELKVISTAFLRLDQLERHPHNRFPLASKVESLAASLHADGLIEPLLVRPMIETDAADTCTYQIISGETRSLAAKSLSWERIHCRIESLDDAEALRKVAIANGQRSDLDPIEQAKLIEQLCKPMEEGGGHLTREEAALAVGLESASAASNAVSLLRLPQVWQKRIADGELQPTFGRCLVKVVNMAAVMAELEKDWDHFKKDPTDDYLTFSSRQNLEDAIQNLQQEHTRPVEDKVEEHFNYGEGPTRISGWTKRLFKMTPELEEQLNIVVVTIRGTPQKRATNLELYDSLQMPLMAKKVGKKTAEQKEADADRPKTPKEVEAAKKKAKEHLNARIAEWRRDWLRRIVASRLNGPSESGDWIAPLIAMWMLTRQDQWSYRQEQLCSIERIVNEIAKENGLRPHGGVWEILYSNKVSMREVMYRALLTDDSDGDGCVWPVEFLEDAAKALKISLAEEWEEMQGNDDASDRPALEAFFGMFTSTQLDDLAKELKEPEVARRKGKKEKVDILVAGTYLSIPKCIPLITQPAKPTKKKRA